MFDLRFSWRGHKRVPGMRFYLQAIGHMHTVLFRVTICPSCACSSFYGSFLLLAPTTLFTASVVPQAYLHLPLVLMPCFSQLSTFATMVPKGHIHLLPLVISRLPPSPACFQYMAHLACCFLLGLISDPTDGGNAFLQSISKPLSDYTTSYSKNNVPRLFKIMSSHQLTSLHSLDRINLD
jgi:hypothetical protein